MRLDTIGRREDNILQMDRKKMVAGTVVLALVAGSLAWVLYQRTIVPGLTASGTIEGTEVTVSSTVVGRVVSIKVDEGSLVKENDVIAEIDPSEIKQGLDSAQAVYQNAKDNFERTKKLYRNQMVSGQQYDAAKSALEVAAAALETVRIRQNNTQITAPISGVVLVKAIEKGELATVGTPIVTMADLSSVKLTVYLAEKDVGKIKLGEEVGVSVDSYPNERFRGNITYISNQAEFTPKSIQTRDERTAQVFAIKIRIPNPDMKLKPGMPADAEFSWNSQ
jgi:HlyD family secretion protein